MKLASRRLRKYSSLIAADANERVVTSGRKARLRLASTTPGRESHDWPSEVVNFEY